MIQACATGTPATSITQRPNKSQTLFPNLQPTVIFLYFCYPAMNCHQSPTKSTEQDKWALLSRIGQPPVWLLIDAPAAMGYVGVPFLIYNGDRPKHLTGLKRCA
ncbi:MAG: hypothetical protein P8X96_09480 [Desulfobacteraceae bacterium]